jgi:Cu-Zn family superoxide dismutase
MKQAYTKQTTVFISIIMSLAMLPVIASDKHDDDDDDDAVSAMAEISGCTDAGISGIALLTERPSSEGVKVVDVVVKVNGMTPGKHAVHIHETAACEPCSAAQGHFDPGPNSNTNPDGNHPFHMGDLINIDVGANGKGKMKTKTSRITLSPGPLSVFDADGSAFIIHDFEDTYCPEGVAAGCAGGSRAACGIIVPVSGDDSDD